MPTILLTDDEKPTLNVLRSVLEGESLDVETACSGEEAIALLETKDFDLLLSDIRMAPIDGMELLGWARANRPAMVVIMFTAFATTETALQTVKEGAFDYVTKPFKIDELLATIQRALTYRMTMTDGAAGAGTTYPFAHIVAESEAMQAVCDMIHRVAPVDMPVLITGETSTGKKLVAKTIHANGPRKDTAFHAIDCSSFTEASLESEIFGHVAGAFKGAETDKQGILEKCNGGTVYLSEIAAMHRRCQRKLLPVLCEGKLYPAGSESSIRSDVRILIGTSTPLEDHVKSGSFREDLYQRLNVLPISIPALRDRMSDIMPLVFFIMRQEMLDGSSLPLVSPDVCDVLYNYAWPGNVRELRSAIKHGIRFSDGKEISKGVLPTKIVADAASSGTNRMDRIHGRFKSLRAFLRAKQEECLHWAQTELTGAEKAKAIADIKRSLAAWQD